MAVLIAVSYYFKLGAFEGLEAKVIDANFKRRGIIEPDKKIIIAGFTDACINAIGKWPWKREVHAEAIKKFTAAGASAIGIDVLFEDQSVKSDDDMLINAIADNKKTVLAAVISPKTIFENGKLINAKHLNLPFKSLSDKAAGVGFISVNYDALNPDGILRCVNLCEQTDISKTFYSFSYEIAKIAGKSSILPVSDERYYINYHGPAKIYDYVTFSKLYSGELPLSYFKDKIVLIGPLATALGDLHHTPYGTIPGTEIQANILDCIINGSFLKRFSSNSILLITFLIVLISLAPFAFFGLVYATFINLAIAVCLIALNMAMFSKFNIILDIIPALAAIIPSYFISALFYSYAKLLFTNAILKKRVRELNALYSISKNISELINLDKILTDVLNEAISALGAERGSLMLIDEDEQKLEVKVVAGIDKPNERKILIPIGEGIAGIVFEQSIPIISNSIETDERFKTFSAQNEPDIKCSRVRNIICVPLLIGENKSIGVINIVNKRDNSKFNAEDVKLTETISGHAATLIENSRLYKLATVDGMTGLYVHRYFQVRFKEEFSRAQRYNKNISTLMTDIDHFKKFNDTYGHQCGDMVLTHVAKIVRDTIRNIDIAARYGGEEFAVVLPETDSEGAYKLAERIRKNVEESACHTPKGDLKVTISLGVACNSSCGVPTHLTLIACADNALYQSKENGRNKVTVFTGKLPEFSDED